MLPGVAEADALLTMRKALKAGDTQKARDAAAKYVLTEAILVAIGSQVLSANVTGMGPKSTEKRAALEAARDKDGNKVWQAHSVRIGDRWIDYTNLGPVSIPMAVASNAYESYLESGRKPGASEVADVFNKVAATVLDATYIKSVGDLMKGISEGTIARMAGHFCQLLEGIIGKAGGSLVGNLATRFVPYGGLAAQGERMTDQERKNPRNLPEYVASRVPGASELVPDKPSPFGGSVQEPQDFLAMASPFRTSARGAPDPVARAFVDAGMGAPSTPNQIRIKSGNSYSPPMALDEHDKAEYTRILGERLAKQLTTTTNNAAWPSMPIAAMRQVLDGNLRAAREYTEQMIYRSWSAEERKRRMTEGHAGALPVPLLR